MGSFSFVALCVDGTILSFPFFYIFFPPFCFLAVCVFVAPTHFIFPRSAGNDPGHEGGILKKSLGEGLAIMFGWIILLSPFPPPHVDRQYLYDSLRTRNDRCRTKNAGQRIGITISYTRLRGGDMAGDFRARILPNTPSRPEAESLTTTPRL